MSVRQSLLAILDQGACYGHQLRHEFDRRTGSTWPLNVGQIYNTLERLERDGLVDRGAPDAAGHVYWRITDAGSAEVARWLSEPVVRAPGTRDELAVKLAVAATLPGVDVAAAIRAQRDVSRDRLRELQSIASAHADDGDPASMAAALVTDSLICAAEAELHWLDRAESRLSSRPGRSAGMELAAERPKRGRPAGRSRRTETVGSSHGRILGQAQA